MNAQDLVDLYERCEAAERTLRHLGYSYVQGAEFWKPPVRNNHKWLQENTLIYRLTDDVRPVNCDEINVTMADGSRSMEKRTERATEILNLLQGVSRVTVENPLGLKKFSALEFINTDEELDAYVAEQVDEAIKAHTAGAATPAAPQPSPSPAPADQQPGDNNVQLDTDSDPTAPRQQRGMAGTLEMGQPVGDGQHEARRHTQAQGDKLLTVAERNLRRFLETAVFRDEADRQAALNCLEVLTAPAPAQPGQDAEIPESVIDAVAAALGDAYDCGRVWSAWSYGTMSSDDFRLVAEDGDRVAEIARAAIDAALAAQQGGA